MSGQRATRGRGGRGGHRPQDRFSSIQLYHARRQEALEYHNSQEFTTSRNEAHVPYPAGEAVWERSNLAQNDDETFEDLYLIDFSAAHRRINRHALRSLSLSPYHKALLNRGLQHRLDEGEGNHGTNKLVETTMGYAAAIGAQAAVERADMAGEVCRCLFE